jgi:hypothetical protein
MRDMLFVSHANPEDNEFTRWITLQLANEGYGVWCDLTKLLGGERFWDDIQAAIRDRTVKFLYVLSKTSNVKDSPRDELEVALKEQRLEKLKDFVIPLWIDDLPPSDFYIRLTNLVAIPFRKGWRPGFATLLEKLERDAVPKRDGFGPEAVRSWWRTFRSPTFAVRETPETLLSNWFPVAPVEYHLHDLRRADPGPLTLPDALPHPAVHHNQYLVTFATAADMAPYLGPLHIEGTRHFTLSPSMDGEVEGFWTRREKTAAITQLLNQAWQQFVVRRGLPSFGFANKRLAFYFKLGTAKDDRVEYFDDDGTRHWRNVVGTTTRGANADGTPRLRYWHFSLEARAVVNPRLGFMVKPHVLFSDDGATIWSSSAQLHRARRSHCRQWWNDRWRDLILGTMAWLAEGQEGVRLPVGQTGTVSVSVTPLEIESPFSYDEFELDQVLKPEDVDLDLDDEPLDDNEENEPVTDEEVGGEG